ncbi:protein of unknown function [Paenibacillus sp. UNCCL117]|uniref:DUF1836 domain-containing protein n=1 Tax=unclassified Paenibacillus TaxID=185978 RepID=UPI00088F1B6E|nr:MULTISPECIES: DUF1836 domain-containing protein [unclassified Paenibacillus]SDD99352.1 protein of unknown function [Paenibacillus sp. cl123]SFW55749.1 protein of unknown function [Paenibacillus sp. UNCCL117]
METFTLTRKEMSSLLISLQGRSPKKPIAILQEAWSKHHQHELRQGASLTAFLSTRLPGVFEKLLKTDRIDGLSLQEIVALGNQIEYTNYSITSVQNWVKRDFKEFLGAPQAGKKYSLQQAALLFIIEDLKGNLDFESIRSLFHIIFRKPEVEHDDLIRPLDLYVAYTHLFEELDQNNDQMLDVQGHEEGKRNHDVLMENMLRIRSDQYVGQLAELTPEQREAVRNVVFIAMVSIQTAYFHSLARQYLNATLFLQDLHDR